MLAIHTILHPTDFSTASRTAFELACSLARDYGARLIVLHVNQTTAIYAPDGIVTAAPVEGAFELRAKLAQLRPDDPRVQVEYKLLDGEPVEQILKAAAHVDLIVLGTHGATGLSRLLMGSVAEDVLRRANCPVLTVRAHAQTTASAPDITATST